jgi:hypothetical protein
LLTDAAQFTTNLDTITNPFSAFPSTFDYYTANASGATVAALAADLTSITTTAAAAVQNRPASRWLHLCCSLSIFLSGAPHASTHGCLPCQYPNSR